MFSVSLLGNYPLLQAHYSVITNDTLLLKAVFHWERNTLIFLALSSQVTV